MTDFISRLAARAVARTPVTRPVPVVAESKVEPAAAPAPQVAAERPVARATPAAASVRSEPPDLRPAEPSRKPVAHEHVTKPVLGDRIVERTLVRETVASPAEPVRAVPALDRAPGPEPAKIVRATPVAAAPASARVVETSITRAASTPAEEPPVRVHIGRLEVRANIEQPPAPPQPMSRPAPSEGLSLGDYLRGRRSA